MNGRTILRGGTVIDPGREIHDLLDVAIEDGLISAVGPGLSPENVAREIDVRGKYVCPGLIDLHGHWYLGSAYGIDPSICLSSGVTTAVDAGTTGFVNFPHFRQSQIETSPQQVLAFINIAAWGLPTILAGELEDLRMARSGETVETLQNNRDVSVGVKVRMGTMCGPHQKEVLERALHAARSAGVPLMVHIGVGADTSDILGRLQSGDILTHCFQNRTETIVGSDALKLQSEAARKQGVIFDVGHGAGSFNWDVARRAFEYHFYPDTISTDLHRFSIDRWAIDMPTTMSKFLHLGMTLDDVILKSTLAPAKVLGRDPELGTLRVGTIADLLVFEVEEGEFLLEDTHLHTEKANRRIKPALVFKAGEMIQPDEPVPAPRPLFECDRELLRSLEFPSL